jgi:predicted nucleic acid-binding protein
MVKSIYLDVCALCRPFDDQSYMRIHLETAAVNLIIAAVDKGMYQMVYSPVHLEEIEAMPNVQESLELKALLTTKGERLEVDLDKARDFAEDLVERGYGVADAAHIAFAVLSEVDFISVDDRLIKKCQNTDLKIWAGTPISFCEKEDLQ